MAKKAMTEEDVRRIAREEAAAVVGRGRPPMGNMPPMRRGKNGTGPGGGLGVGGLPQGMPPGGGMGMPGGTPPRATRPRRPRGR